MNTGEKNIKGRIIYRGSKGGLYVLGPSGKPIYKFTRQNITNRLSNLKIVPNRVKKVYHARGIKPPNENITNRLSNLKIVPNRVKNKLKSILSNIRKPKTKSLFMNVSRAGRLLTRVNIRGLNGANKISEQTITLNTRKSGNNVNKRFLIGNEINLPSQEWIDKQTEYIKGLNVYDKLTAQSYTNMSHSWVGPYLLEGTKLKHINSKRFDNSNLLVPLFAQICLTNVVNIGNYEEVWKFRNKSLSLKEKYDEYKKWLSYMNNNGLSFDFGSALELYIKDLKRIISGAPQVKQSFYVYRGMDTDIFQGKPGTTHTMKTFSSTSVDSYTSIYGYGTNVLKIHIRPGTRALFLAPLNYWNRSGESEVLLNIGTKFYIHKRNVKGYLNKTKNLKVTELSVYT